MSAKLAAEAWAELLYMDVVGLGGFRAIHRSVIRTPVRSIQPAPDAVSDVVQAMTNAVTVYFKHAKCLQRSAAVARLLRRRGVRADVVIGCHLAPLKAHAWVEVAGDVVSDYETGVEFMKVVDRW